MDAHPFGNRSGSQECCCSFVNKISGIGGQARIATRQRYALSISGEAKGIEQAHWVQHRLQFVEAIGALAQNIEKEVALDRGFFLKNHWAALISSLRDFGFGWVGPIFE